MNIKVMKAAAVWGGVVCVLSFVATGCGQKPLSSVEVVSEESDKAEPSIETEELPAAGADQTDDIGRAGIDAVQNDTAQQDMTDEAENEGQQGSQEGRWHVFSPEVAKVVDADFAGKVWKIDTDRFYIVEEVTEIMEDGSLLGIDVSDDAQVPDSDLIQVVFGEDTRFYIRTIYDNGSRTEDQEAVFQDLEKYVSVEMKGEFINDVFHAVEIRIVKVA